MKRLMMIRLHKDTCGNKENTEQDKRYGLPYEHAANALMKASGYIRYVAKHGYHFTPELAETACGMMENADGTAHRWSAEDVLVAVDGRVPEGVTLGDMVYTANMAYADFYPKAIKTEEDCIQYAIAVASDPDGYDGMAFCRWTADLIGKGATIDWEKLE